MNTSQMESHTLPQNGKHDPIEKSNVWLQQKRSKYRVLMVDFRPSHPFTITLSKIFLK